MTWVIRDVSCRTCRAGLWLLGSGSLWVSGLVCSAQPCPCNGVVLSVTNCT